MTACLLIDYLTLAEQDNSVRSKNLVPCIQLTVSTVLYIDEKKRPDL